MKKSILLHIIMVAWVFATTTVYDVEPSYNDNDSALAVSQSFIATADSISEVAFFCGRKIVSGHYNFYIADSNGSQISPTISSDSADRYDYELVFATFNSKVCVKKGIKYRLAVTHSQDSLVNFYYNRFDPYPDGQLIGQPSNYDLAARIIGINEFRDELRGEWGQIFTLYIRY